MLREHIFSSRTPTDPHFRWRGGDVSRIEGLSDAAFAFAMTLLLVDSFQGIDTSAELIDAMSRLLALAACFTIVIWIWAVHYKFFRRYGLEDNYTIVLNSALLFAVMVYVYPLKFLFSFVIDVVIFRNFPVDAAGNKFHPVLQNDSLAMMQIYGVGYLVIFLLFALMTHHAYKQREALQLDAIEVHLTKGAIGTHLLTAAVGVVSIAITLIPWPLHSGIVAGIAGMFYAANGPVQWVWGTRVDRRLKALRAELVPAAESPSS